MLIYRTIIMMLIIITTYHTVCKMQSFFQYVVKVKFFFTTLYLSRKMYGTFFCKLTGLVDIIFNFRSLKHVVVSLNII